MKPFWADYVNHMLRYYVRHNNPSTPLEKENHRAVDVVVSDLSKDDWEIIKFIYSRDNLHECITLLAITEGLSHKYCWRLVTKVSKEIAKERKLI